MFPIRQVLCPSGSIHYRAWGKEAGVGPVYFRDEAPVGSSLGARPSSPTALNLEPDMALFFSGFRVFSSLISFWVSLWPSSKSEFC